MSFDELEVIGAGLNCWVMHNGYRGIIETHYVCALAEREGFEPSKEVCAPLLA